MEGKKRTEKIGIILMLICACCLCAGQFIWKCWDGILPLAVGFGIYGVGALAMLVAYRFGNLSTLQPINSVSYVISAILGYLAFDEAITMGKIAGIVVIVIGVVLLAKGEAS